VPIVDADVTILHDGYADATRNLGKQRRNLAILEKQITAGGAYALTYFLAAGARQDLGDYAEAIPVYEECIRRAPTGDPFRQGAQVGIAICLHMLGRHADVCALTAEAVASGQAHPEQRLTRGNSLKALGDLAGSIGVLRTVLGLKDAVFIPPCDLTSAKLEAVVAIAAVLKMQGDESAALKLMKSALERRRADLPLDAAWLETILPL
jgi:tetratricopeptide (TPR) repeat protein